MINLLVVLAAPTPAPTATATAMADVPTGHDISRAEGSHAATAATEGPQIGGLELWRIALPEMRHHPERGTITIEITEATVVALYLSGCAFFIGGLWIGCIIWQRQAKQLTEACECAWCAAQYQTTRKLAEGGFGEASLVTRGGKTYVLKRIGCANINAANQALMEAGCLQRLRHENVVRFEDLFMHRHDNGGCSVMIVMEYCAAGDLIDRLECSRNERALSELQVIKEFPAPPALPALPALPAGPASPASPALLA